MSVAGAGYSFVSSSKTSSSYDPKLARAQLEALQIFRNSFGIEALCETFLMIQAKREMQFKYRTRLIPFKFSRIQEDMQNKAGSRNITLKPRQIGSTTFHVLCRLFIPAILNPGTSGLLISQTKGYGAQHFRIFQRALQHFARTPIILGQMGAKRTRQYAADLAANLLHTQYSARHEIVFDFLDSKVLVETAENPDAGTGLTINYLVATEVAYWKRKPEALLSQAKEAVPLNGTIDYESTPNGMAGYFYEEWQRAQQENPEFRSHFYPWWWEEEYQQEPAVEEASVTEEEAKMRKEFDWTLKQLAWRRGKQKALRERFPEKYPEDSQTCFLTSGRMFFDRENLRWLKIELENKKPLDSYHDGLLRIYKRRIKGRRYLVAADVAEGKLVSTENPDYSAAVVLDIDTGEEMASYRTRIPPEDFAEDLVDIAHMYNDALVAPERNGPGANVILTLTRQLLYGNIYMHREWHRERKQVIPVAGFLTNQRTRPIAVNKLAAMIREAPQFWHDKTFVDEALNFVWVSSKKTEFGGKMVPQGAPGSHDDTVLARAIGAYVRLVALGYLDPIESPSERYGQTGDETEDEAA